MQNFVGLTLASSLSRDLFSEILWLSVEEMFGSSDSIRSDLGCLFVAVLTVIMIEKTIMTTITVKRIG